MAAGLGESRPWVPPPPDKHGRARAVCKRSRWISGSRRCRSARASPVAYRWLSPGLPGRGRRPGWRSRGRYPRPRPRRRRPRDAGRGGAEGCGHLFQPVPGQVGQVLPRPSAGAAVLPSGDRYPAVSARLFQGRHIEGGVVGDHREPADRRHCCPQLLGEGRLARDHFRGDAVDPDVHGIEAVDRCGRAAEPGAGAHAGPVADDRDADRADAAVFLVGRLDIEGGEVQSAGHRPAFRVDGRGRARPEGRGVAYGVWARQVTAPRRGRRRRTSSRGIPGLLPGCLRGRRRRGLPRTCCRG